MNAVELLQYSLETAFGILGQVAADLTQEQANWAPPGKANPIGALYWHTLASTDDIVHGWCQGQKALRERDGWTEKALTTTVAEPEPGGDYFAYMREIRVDLPVLHEYAGVLATAVQDWVGAMAPSDLARSVETPAGEYKLGQLLELFGAWHINSHCGEIAALKGCQGAKGYPF